ncbi:MAG: phage tail family protein [Christensenella sp.]|nr:phage tail family protein [Christensenella sp.]
MPSRKEFKLQIGSLCVQTGEGTGWRCTEINGDDYLDLDASVKEYAAGDGGQIQNDRFPTRYIDLNLQADVEYGEIDATDAFLKAFLDGKTDAVLTIYKGTTQKVGYGRVVAVKKKETRWMRKPDIMITFMMPNPWFSGSAYTESFVSDLPLATYPLSYLPDTPITVGLSIGGNSRTFTVGGHGDTGFVLTLTAIGAAVNPSVENQDGREIITFATMESGDVMTISTVTRGVYVKLNGVLCRYDLSSDFFQLSAGLNTLTVSADSGVGSLQKSITWKELYRG